MKKWSFLIFLLASVYLWGGSLEAVVAMGTQSALYPVKLGRILKQIPQKAPVVYVHQTSDLIPEKNTAIIGTNLYLVGEKETKTAKVYIFVQKSNGWDLVYETDMDERVAVQGLPASFQVSLSRIDFIDVDADRSKEVIIIWDTEPWQAFSMAQCSTVIHILDYNENSNQFYEVSEDKLIYNTYKEKGILLNVDCDLQDEIILFDEIWEGDTCVTCAKRLTIDVWRLHEGKLEKDPDWNDGKTFETSKKYSLRHEEDWILILRQLVSHSPTSCSIK